MENKEPTLPDLKAEIQRLEGEYAAADAAYKDLQVRDMIPVVRCEELRLERDRVHGELLKARSRYYDLAVELEDRRYEIMRNLKNATAEELLQAKADLEKLRNAVRKVRDEKGDRRCVRDIEAVYALMPEGYTPRPWDSKVELEYCKKYIASQEDEKTVYVSPQDEIDRLTAALKRALNGFRLMAIRTSAFAPSVSWDDDAPEPDPRKNHQDALDRIKDLEGYVGRREREAAAFGNVVQYAIPDEFPNVGERAWNDMNNRRAELIEKGNKLTAGEALELKYLDAMAGRKVEEKFPDPPLPDLPEEE